MLKKFCALIMLLLLCVLTAVTDADAAAKKHKKKKPAANSLEARAERYDAEAQYQLGKKYYSVKNYKQAVNYLRKAAEQGFEQAIIALKELGID